MHDFWRKDVAGLYAAPGADGKAIKLIELSYAVADDHPVTSLAANGFKSPKNGYWYCAIRHEDEDPQKLDPQRFAFAAIPVEFPRHDKFTYIVDEANCIYRAELPSGQKVTVFPRDLSGWSKLD
jgi:hypothetical protein